MIVAENIDAPISALGHLQLVQNALESQGAIGCDQKGAEMQRSVTSPARGSLTSEVRRRGVAMMQTAHLGDRDDLACRGWLYAARLRTILVEREMCSGPVMIFKITRQDMAQVTLVENDYVIQAFAADRADEALHIGVLPG